MKPQQADLSLELGLFAFAQQSKELHIQKDVSVISVDSDVDEI